MEQFDTLEEVAVWLLNHEQFAPDSMRTMANLVGATQELAKRVQHLTEAGLSLGYENFDPDFLRAPILTEDSPEVVAVHAEAIGTLLYKAQEVIDYLKIANE